MTLENINPTGTVAWQKLRAHFETIAHTPMQKLFTEDGDRTRKFHIQWNDFLLDYSKNRITSETVQLLLALAEEAHLKEAIQNYFSGDKINVTENRAVLHTALRSSEKNILVDGANILTEVEAVQLKIKSFAEAIISGNRKGFTGKTFTDVVNIGIGGSDLGPDMAVEALQFYKNHLNLHFVSNIDGDHVAETIKKLNPETTLFVVVSKTFTTQETLSNAITLKNWFLQSGKAEDVAKHFVAVSTNLEKVTEFGITSENTFPMWDWVGGRFSMWSAVGLSIALAVGYDNFKALLDGAEEMDQHFKNEPFEKNIPILLALLSIWYNNFFGCETEAVIPYSQYLKKLAPYLQQAVMESNGKCVDRNGNPVKYQTGNILWGEPGSNAQHAFFQLIHQGTKLIPCDFIGFKECLHGNKEHHDKLMSNFFAQTEALLMGKTDSELTAEGSKNAFLMPFKTFEGNKPTNTLLIKKLTPKTLGSLIAMYEHKIFVQGVIWNIFSYDQFGVEYGKQLATTILEEIQTGTAKPHDSSTTFLLQEFLK
ncbi:glucose-6-phosphate isomerase [Flavobacterium cauense R2A-7]|uniref:Glucose-6-phosphate isomerase n=1 Tax=Flavobacterium cauense R2A-7 TaxID=1341154 RepID=A0A562LP11_9FLAO|nr:glucose-6-phosphate isomerase [Flavobacterium cauense]KGO80342.1 glucose-6-phosphate isomerase [Flavobacterium cauense R2A-7]TWI09345.1 glucose-6-phosphate isomerase [Flavobacterium cauense R2A-7]